MSKWFLSLPVLAIASAAGVTLVGDVDGRLSRIESRQAQKPGYVARLSAQVASLRRDLVQAREELEALEAEDREQARLADQVAELEGELALARRSLRAQSEELDEVGERQDELVRETLGEGLADLHRNLEARWDDVSRTLEATARIAETNRHTFDDFVRELPREARVSRDVQSMWDHLLGPTVQIADESTVGSGVLLQSEELREGDWRTHVLTAYHVVRDVLDGTEEAESSIPTYVYEVSGSRSRVSATLLEYDAALDVALLELHTGDALRHGARLPSAATLAERSVFDTIYAVGCPLGNDPIPTFGEIADTHHEVDGDAYWMISAPTYIGNSGGGVFDAESHELLGIFSKIYTHGNLRPTVVPHMGLVTPLARIYEWLAAVGYEQLVPSDRE